MSAECSLNTLSHWRQDPSYSIAVSLLPPHLKSGYLYVYFPSQEERSARDNLPARCMAASVKIALNPDSSELDANEEEICRLSRAILTPNGPLFVRMEGNLEREFCLRFFVRLTEY